MVPPAHHPEPSRRTISKFKILKLEIFLCRLCGDYMISGCCLLNSVYCFYNTEKLTGKPSGEE
jgi:hypothetical protein